MLTSRNTLAKAMLHALAIGATVISAASAQDTGTLDKAAADKAFPAKPPYSPYAGRNFPTRPFFGDTHLHTSFSMDAGAFGARLDSARRLSLRARRSRSPPPAASRRSSRARSISSSSPTTRTTWASSRPASPASPSSSPTRRAQVVRHDPGRQGRRGGARHHRQLSRRGTFPKAIYVLARHARLPRRVAGDHRRRRALQRAGPLHRLHRLRVDLATQAATTCIATSSSATTATRPARSSRSPCMPPLGSDNPVDLWKWMDAYEKKTGGSVLAIAHNGNLSNGRMFPIVEAFGKAIDREYAETARQVGAALRGHADQGRRRGASVPLAERRVRRLRALGQRQPRRQRGEEEGHARVRVCPLGAEERPQARSRSSARIPTSSAWSAAATRTPASPPWRRTTSSARPRRRSPARSA